MEASSPQLRIELLDSGLETAYQHFIGSIDTASFTHTLAYRQVLEQSGLGEPVYWVARRSDDVVAVLPCFLTRAVHGGALNSLPNTQSIGGVLMVDGLSEEEQSALRWAFHDAIQGFAKDNNVAVYVEVLSPLVAEKNPPFPVDFTWERKTNVIDLSNPLQLHTIVKRSIRKAEQCEPKYFVAKNLEEAKRVWHIYAEYMQSIGVSPRPWHFYEALFHVSSPECGARFTWAQLGDKPVSSLILLTHRSMIEYHSIGNTPEGRDRQVGTWLCMQEIHASQDRKVGIWNWGVSPNQAVHTFKQRFGGTDVTHRLNGVLFDGASSLRSLTPLEVADQYPGYFVLPHEMLASDSEEAS